MPLVAVLDAAVIYPMSLCDLLLRLAEQDLYQPRWSARILEEARRGVSKRESPSRADRRIEVVAAIFPQAMVPPSAEEESIVLPDPNDRHVVATAITSGASQLVTRNLRDFPATDLPPGLGAVDPDTFLQQFLAEHCTTVVNCIHAQADDTGRYGKAQLSVEYVLRSLELAGAPRFAARATKLLDQPG